MLFDRPDTKIIMRAAALHCFALCSCVHLVTTNTLVDTSTFEMNGTIQSSAEANWDKTSIAAETVTISFASDAATEEIKETLTTEWIYSKNDQTSSSPKEAIWYNVMWFGFIPVLSVLGIIGNVSGMCFLHNFKKFNQTFHLLLFALMAVDLVFLVVLLMMDCIEIVGQFDKDLADYLKCYAFLNLDYIQAMTYTTCGHLIMIMSFERLFSIKFPMKIKIIKHRWCASVGIFFLAIINAAGLIPAFLSFESKEILDQNTNKTICISAHTKWANETVSFNQDYVLISVIVVRLLPGISTAVANVYILILTGRRRLVRASLFADKVYSLEYFEQLKMTLTLIVLSISLLLSMIPSGVAVVLIKYFPETYGPGGSQRVTYLRLFDTSYILRVFSAADDFLIYIILSRDSRGRFVRMVKDKCRCCSKNDENIEMRVTYHSGGPTSETILHA